jgi:hypothetical protein
MLDLEVGGVLRHVSPILGVLAQDVDALLRHCCLLRGCRFAFLFLTPYAEYLFKPIIYDNII